MNVIKAFDPDVVVDSFSPFACLAARICGKPLVAVLQADFLPASRGFIWWEEDRPNDLPDPAPVSAVSPESSTSLRFGASSKA